MINLGIIILPANMKLNIRKAQSSDAKRIREIQRAGWLATYPNPEFQVTQELISAQMPITEERIEKTKSYIPTSEIYLVAEVDSKVVGLSCIVDRDGKATVSGTYLDPEYTGRGIGTRLMTRLIEKWQNPRDLYLEVATYNDGAINFYQQHGFKLVDKSDVHKHYVTEDVYIPVVEMVRRYDR